MKNEVLGSRGDAPGAQATSSPRSNTMSALRTLVVVLGAGWIVLFWLSLRAVHWATYDDSFYYFGIARNLAHGWGSTFDRLHPTNGYHPLWLLVCAGVFKLKFDDEEAVRVLLALQILGLGTSVMLGVRVLARTAERLGSPKWSALAVFLAGLVLVLFAFSPFGITLYANGLESTCSLLFFALLVERLDNAEGKLDGQRLLLGFLAAMLFLARTDAILLLPWLAVYAILCGGRRREVLQIVAVPVVVVVAYLIFNRIEFGSFTQVSGDLKRIVPTIPRLLAGIAIALAPAAVIAIVRKVRFAMIPTTARFIDHTAPLLGFVCAVTAYYETLQSWTQIWYFVTPTFYLAMIVGRVIVDLSTAERWAPRLAGVLVAGGAIAFFVGSVRDAMIPGATAMIDADREAALWIKNNLEPSAVLGSWDAGALGYYSHRRVVNLDGEVGSVELCRAIRANKTKEWTKSERVRIDYVVNHTFNEDGGSEYLHTLSRDWFGDEGVRGWTILHVWDYLYRGGANGKKPRVYGMAVWLARLD